MNSERKVVMFVIPGLSGGGAERVLTVLVRRIDRAKYQPVIILFHAKNDYQLEIPADVQTITLGEYERYGVVENLRLAWSLARVIRRIRPRVIFSIMHYTNNIAALAKKISFVRVPLIFSYHNNLSKEYKPGRLRWKSLVTWIQKTFINPEADRIVCVSRGIQDDLILNWEVYREKTCVIYNPVEVNRIKELAAETVDHQWIDEKRPFVIACGRLTQQKNYPLLLRAFTAVVQKMPELMLMVLGDGELRSELIAYANQLQLTNHVEFNGFQKNPFKYISRAKALVLSSSWEGFGNVLIEAMACGTAVISTRCPSGPEEIISGGINGLLVPVNNEVDLANAIICIVQDSDLRNSLNEASKYSILRYSAENIMREYEQLIESVIASYSNDH